MTWRAAIQKQCRADWGWRSNELCIRQTKFHPGIEKPASQGKRALRTPQLRITHNSVSKRSIRDRTKRLAILPTRLGQKLLDLSNVKISFVWIIALLSKVQEPWRYVIKLWTQKPSSERAKGKNVHEAFAAEYVTRAQKVPVRSETTSSGKILKRRNYSKSIGNHATGWPCKKLRQSLKGEKDMHPWRDVWEHKQRNDSVQHESWYLWYPPSDCELCF